MGSINRRFSSFSLLAVVFLLTILSCDSGLYRKRISRQLKTSLEILREEEQPVIEGSVIQNPDIIARVYELGRGMLTPRWDHQDNIEQMVNMIRAIRYEGLNPEDYHLGSIENLLQRIDAAGRADAQQIVALEMLMSDAFLLLSSHLAGGKTHPETIDPQWKASFRSIDIDWDVFMDTTLLNRRVEENLLALRPRHKEYVNLKNALEKYLGIADQGGWNQFHTTLPKIEKGMKHPDVTRLRQRLAVTQGETLLDSNEPDLFDQEMLEHVLLFQRRNGLTTDGIAGRSTLAALNIPVEDRISAIRVNLERWRWLSDELGDRYIKVNIANYELQVIESDSLVFKSDAIVGRPYRRTPVFSSRMTYLVLNPDWIVPPTILYNDVIPAVRKDPGYLRQKNMQVLGSDGRIIDPATVDWSRYVNSGFPYRIRQLPGADNALGRIKFMFPNQYNVYIHDTPVRNLFQHTDRSFSSGCIRINRPVELAEYLLRDNDRWTPSQIRAALNSGTERSISLVNPIRVHLLYLTSWADDHGIVYFRNDVYERDGPLLAALSQGHTYAEIISDELPE